MSSGATTRANPDVESYGGKAGIWFLVASELILFGSLIMCYLLMYSSRPDWDAGRAELVPAMGILNTVILLVSSWCAVMAHAAVDKGDLKLAQKRLIYTLLLAGAFLVVKGFEYSSKFHHGHYPNSGGFFTFYFTLTGLHALHVIVGMIAIGGLVYAQSVDRLKLYPQRVELVGIYWHLVDVIWIFLFPLLYLS